MQQAQNHFQLLGLPVSYQVNQDELSKNYQALLRVVHPDRFASGTDQERRQAVQQAAAVNDAFQVLKDPLKRARYLLALQGGALDDESNTIMDTEFLMSQMELREELESLVNSQQAMEMLDQFIGKICAELNELEDKLSSLFINSDSLSLEKASQLIRKMQFYKRLQEEAIVTEEDLTLDF